MNQVKRPVTDNNMRDCFSEPYRSITIAVVKKRGMFGDSGAEIERLTGSIKTDMAALNSRLDSLQVSSTTQVTVPLQNIINARAAT